MLSLSLFCSSQRISVALYRQKKLMNFFSNKIVDNKIESIFSILKKAIRNNSIENLSKIFVSSGPGSFTAIRSIKAIAQGLSLATSAKIISVSTFESFLNNLKNKNSYAIIYFESNKQNFFFQMFKLGLNKNDIKSKVFYGDAKKLKNFYLTKKKKYKDLIFVCDTKKNLGIFEDHGSKNGYTFNLDAKSIANACFSGFGKKDLKIFYHHTYYEKN